MEFLRRGIPAVLSVMVFKKRVFLVIGGKLHGQRPHGPALLLETLEGRFAEALRSTPR